jgi:nucleoside-diphosphate-sugar epimerase
MAPTVLITGGAGFIGHRLTQRLLGSGHRVVVADLAVSDDARSGGAESATLNVTDRAGVWQLLEDIRPELVVHLAAILSGGAEADPAQAFDVNVGGTFNVLEGSRRAGVSRLLIASSVAVYDAPDPGAPCDETVSVAPLGTYGMTKASLEGWSAFYARRHGLDVRVVRPAGLVGPGRDAGGAASNWTTALIQEPLAGRAYVCPVGPDDALPVVYHTDFLDGLFAMCRPERLPHAVYNLGSCRVTAGELARLVQQRIRNARITFEPNPVARFVVGRLRSAELDSRRAARDFDYRPRQDTPTKMVDRFIAEVRDAQTLS